ncbi:MAG TPA: translation initiation factor IF-2 [Candidatus Peribacteraceae bacterium]|nr:translation initiation factor IF-2 [Candidatus Peribacteraceae bacterium]
MRLVQVAKALGMTGQQLRKELTEVDFGIKPTDREVPDNLAHGIIRFVARKHNIQVDMDALGAGFGDEEREEKQENASTDNATATVATVGNDRGQVERKENIHVLRKLTLDDVPKEAIEKQATQLQQSKEEKEERAREERESAAIARRKQSGAAAVQEQIKKKTGPVLLPAQITVKEFAEKAGVQVPKVIQALMKNGVMATITQSIDYDTAAIVASELGVAVEREQTAAKVEDLLSKNLRDLLKDDTENLEVRPPIVVVMGHVDHGKTSILDAIRKTDVAAKESGGITQHIGAYQVMTQSGKQITFLDTPGHQAFTAMRARGAQVTDIAILVVSAEEGVKETTIEAIDHAKDAGVPIIVAINKMDRPNADPDRVKGELAAHGLQPEEWGGSVPFVPCSAVTKMGIDQLVETILLVAEISEFKANPKRPAVGTVIESHLDPALGPLATVIVNAGTLAVGDAFVCGHTVGKVRAMTDAANRRLDEVPPSGAVRLSGFGSVPTVGDILQVVGSEREARDLLKQLMDREGAEQKRGLSDLVSMLHEGKLRQLKIVLKADAQGSLEAIEAALAKQGTADVAVKVIHGAIGAVSENDVMMASASTALVLAFRAAVPPAVQRTAERENVQIKEYDVIYSLLEDVQGLLEGLLVPEEQEKILGHLEVKGVFLTKKNEQIIGGRVTDGIVKRVQFRLMRGELQVGTGRILSLKRVDTDIKEAKADSECGMRVETSVPVETGDVLEVFNREFKKKEE